MGDLKFIIIVEIRDSATPQYTRCKIVELIFFNFILVIHDFDESPANVTVNSEASRSVIRFTCHVNSIPEATVLWQRNGVLVPSNKK